MRRTKFKIETVAVHGGQKPDPVTGAIATNITVAKNGAFLGLEKPLKLDYSRSYHPTREVLENLISELLGGGETIAFSSGIAAIHCFFATLDRGDHIICANKIYGGSVRLADLVLSKFLEIDFADPNDHVTLKKLIKPNTKYILIETPTNPLLEIVDLEKLNRFSKETGIPYVIDNTFATPYLLSPFDFGAEVVIHSTSKYLGGHDDLLGGTVTVRNKDLAEKIRLYAKSLGPVPGPHDIYNTIRGIKTLSVRMDRHCDSAKRIAKYLDSHKKIERVYYPGLRSHPRHEIAKKQLKDFGGVISFEVVGNYRKFATSIAQSKKHTIYLTESLGGVESLLTHPATMSHAYLGEDGRQKAGIKDSLFRLSVGLEHVDDLTSELETALSQL